MLGRSRHPIVVNGYRIFALADLWLQVHVRDVLEECQRTETGLLKVSFAYGYSLNSCVSQQPILLDCPGRKAGSYTALLKEQKDLEVRRGGCSLGGDRFSCDPTKAVQNTILHLLLSSHLCLPSLPSSTHRHPQSRLGHEMLARDEQSYHGPGEARESASYSTNSPSDLGCCQDRRGRLS